MVEINLLQLKVFIRYVKIFQMLLFRVTIAPFLIEVSVFRRIIRRIIPTLLLDQISRQTQFSINSWVRVCV